MRLGVSAALVAGSIVPGDVSVDDGRVTGVGLLPAGTSGLAAPGFVDVQINGFAGVDFVASDDAGYAHAGVALAATGVVAYQPTFISCPIPVGLAAITRLGTLEGAAAGPRILPAHVEGPFLSPVQHGAHNAGYLLPGDIALADALCAAGPVGYVTVAPEITCGLEVIERLVARGVVVSLGHSDADGATATAAFDRGARAVTHIFNAMRRWKPRDPGLAGVALSRGDVFVTAIIDNIHLAPETGRLLIAAAGERLVLITDAIEAAGQGDGIYRLGDRSVHVRGAEARLADGTLAGSILSMDQAVRNVVSLGASLELALAAASSNPARLLRRDDLGQLQVGGRADIVVLDDRLEVQRTLVGGAEIYAA
jgi:N-acetylglucosamine-6-phosphate deacetylase